MSIGHVHAHGALTQRAALASVSVALGLGLLKLHATAATGSVAMLGSLADTALDLLASLITLFGVRIAAQPADHDHRFGHGKAEAIAALMQTMLILFSAAGIAWRAVLRLMTPVAPAAPEVGVGVSLIAIAATLALVAYQRHVVRRTGSIAISTDQLHYQSDLLLNGAVIAALLLSTYAGVSRADPVLGLAIAAYLAWGAVKSAHQAIDMLMDREWPEARREELRAAVAGMAGVDGIHELRTRRSGHTDFIQFHIWVDPDMTVAQAHDIVDAVEDRVRSRFADSEVLIHVDPRGHYDQRTIDDPHEETGHGA